MKTKVNPKDRCVIIMAGGRRERFWPVSREKRLVPRVAKFVRSLVEAVKPKESQ